MPQEPRDTNKYHLKRGRKIIRSGITNDLERREKEHQAQYPGSRVVKVGHKTTRTAAREWEKEQTKGTP